MTHTSVGVYKNLDYESNCVCSNELEQHIEYNKTMRFGRALLIDGKVVYKGYFSEEDIPMLEEKFGNIVNNNLTKK